MAKHYEASINYESLFKLNNIEKAKQYFIIECNLCGNLLNSDLNDKSYLNNSKSNIIGSLKEKSKEVTINMTKHLESYHNITNISKDLSSYIKINSHISIKNIFHNYNLKETCILNDDDVYQCNKCFILMINNKAIIDYHNSTFNCFNKVIQTNINEDISKELDINEDFNINMIDNNDFLSVNQTASYIYCLKCKLFIFIEPNETIKHSHCSFLSLSENSSNILYDIQQSLIFDKSYLSDGKSDSESNHSIKIHKNPFLSNFNNHVNVDKYKLPNNISNHFHHYNNELHKPMFLNHKKKKEVEYDFFNQANNNNSNHSVSNKFSNSLNSNNSFFNNIVYKKEIKIEKLDDVIKENELFSSSQRVISDELNTQFQEKFIDKTFDFVKILDYDTHAFYSKPRKFSPLLCNRIKNEMKNIKKILPCDFNSSYFIRADENFPNFLKILISGCRGTPYEHGLFEFDLFLSEDYPKTPPLCNLITTGNGTVRFNPNLYSNGYVCLSILGTWSGQNTEKWDPKTSNIARILISLSSLVMNNEVGCNEPGHENLLSSVDGIKVNEAYCNIVRLGNIKFAMINMLNKGPKCYMELIKEIFKFKKEEMIKDIEIWLDRIKNVEYKMTGVAQQNSSIWNPNYNIKENLIDCINNDINNFKDMLSKL